MNEKIETVGDLIKILQEKYHPSTKIVMDYIDIYGLPHTRTMFKNSLQIKDGMAYLNLGY